MSKNLLTLEEVAAFYQVSYRSVQHWTKRGWLSIVRIGSRVYYPESALSLSFSKNGLKVKVEPNPEARC
jgi:hypothetical protein